MTFTKRLFTILILAAGIAACGQSGPLYLPGNPSEVQNLPSQVPDVQSENDEEDADEADGGR